VKSRSRCSTGPTPGCAPSSPPASRDPAGSWYTPDQTVGFWIRRMAQETVIHRIDKLLKVFVA
jgi:hypothetical protein